MAHPRAFVSFDYDHDKDQKILFCGQPKNPLTPFDVQDWSSKTTLPQDQWEKLIKSKINCCDLMIVLVGKKTYSASGVVKEIKFAKEQNVPVFGVFIDGAGATTPLPLGLSASDMINWNWKDLSRAIQTAMKKGKHAGK